VIAIAYQNGRAVLRVNMDEIDYDEELWPSQIEAMAEDMGYPNVDLIVYRERNGAHYEERFTLFGGDWVSDGGS